jgi:hypothetical protein
VFVNKAFEQFLRLQHQRLDWVVDVHQPLERIESFLGTASQHRVVAFFGHHFPATTHEFFAGQVEDVFGVKHEPVEIKRDGFYGIGHAVALT